MNATTTRTTITTTITTTTTTITIELTRYCLRLNANYNMLKIFSVAFTDFPTFKLFSNIHHQLCGEDVEVFHSKQLNQAIILTFEVEIF